MSFLNKLFRGKEKSQKEAVIETPLNLSPDEQFVHNFKEKGGKFLYCTTQEEVLVYLKNIFKENIWETVHCTDTKLSGDLSVIEQPKNKDSLVFYTTCEHLIVDDASILFSSNQLKEVRLSQYAKNFIVFATTSQLLLTKDDGLTSIKKRFKKEIPTNISAIKDYRPYQKDPNFLNYGNTNSKNLYLILLEDL